MSAATSNTATALADMAQRAATLHRQSTARWLECAHLLLEAREVAGHGQWEGFLRSTGIPARTVRRMVRYARAGIKPAMMAVLMNAEIDRLIFRANSLHGYTYLYRAEKVLEKLGPDHAHWNEWLRPDEFRARESNSEWQWSLAGAFVQAVINAAGEYGYNPGEFATFIADWPRRYLPASVSTE